MAQTTDLSGLVGRMKAYSAALLSGTDRVLVEIASAVHEGVVLGTPVDTGKARSNWLVTVGQESFDVIEPFAPGEKLGIAERANAQAALALGKNALSTFSLFTAASLPGAPTDLQQFVGISGTNKVIYIQNNVDYIGLLNGGSSKQAPALFVQAAVQAGIEKARRALVLGIV